MWQHKVFVVFERTDKEPVLLYPTPPQRLRASHELRWNEAS